MILAGRFGAGIVSVDSMQVYRGMDIGTAKPSPAERAAVPHHLIDIADPADPFTVAQFQEAGRAVLASAGVPLLVVGGSGLHFRALVDPLRFPPSDAAVRARIEALPAEDAVDRLLRADPTAGSHVDLANPRRVVRALEVLEVASATPSQRAAAPEAVAVREYRSDRPFIGLGIDPGDALAERARRRFHRMMDEGLLAEVGALAGSLGATASQAVGYREMLRVVRGEWSEAEGVRRAIDATTALARRQRTFHRRDPRVRWLQWDDDPAAVADQAGRILEEAGWSS